MGALQYALPGLQIVCIDIDPKLDLSHLRGPLASGQVQYYSVSAFAPEFEALVRERCSDASVEWSCAVGTHLCGSLSPRLVEVFRAQAAVDTLVLSPCCLKGWMGRDVTRRAKAEKREPYSVLCETMLELVKGCFAGTTPPPEPQLRATLSYHKEVASVKSGYIEASRPPRRPKHWTGRAPPSRGGGPPTLWHAL